MTTNNEHKKLNAPNLRFKEFEGEWEEHTLGEVVEFSKERVNTKNLSSDNYVATENMLQNYQGIIAASNVPTDINVIKFSKGDVLLSNIRPYLKKIWFADKNGGCSADVFVFKALSACIPDFLHYIIANDRFINFAMSGAKGVKMPRGDKEQMKTYKIGLPSIEEQKKIAKLLSLLDERIATQSKVIEDLKKLKCAIIEKHYRQAKLHKYKICDLGEPFSVGSLSKEDLSEEGYECILYGELFTTYDSMINEVKSHTNKITNMTLSQKGDLLFPSSTTVDAVSLISPSVIDIPNVVLGGDMFGIHIDTKFNAYYLSYYINIIARKKLAIYAKGSTIIHLHYKDIAKAQLLLPDLSEQGRIAKCMMAEDNKIKVEEQLLTTLEKQKQYLLRQMFI